MCFGALLLFLTIWLFGMAQSLTECLSCRIKVHEPQHCQCLSGFDWGNLMNVLLPDVNRLEGFSFKDFLLRQPVAAKVPGAVAKDWKRAAIMSVASLPFWGIAGTACGCCFLFFCFPLFFPLIINILSALGFMYVIASRYGHGREGVYGDMFGMLGRSVPGILMVSVLDYFLLFLILGLLALVFILGHLSEFHGWLISDHMAESGIADAENTGSSFFGVRMFSFAVSFVFGSCYFFFKAYAMPLIVLGRVSAPKALWLSMVAVRRNMARLWSCMFFYALVFSLILLICVNTLFLFLSDGFTFYLSVFMQALTGYVSEDYLAAGLTIVGILLLPVLTFILATLWPGFYFGGQGEAVMDIFWPHLKSKYSGH